MNLLKLLMQKGMMLVAVLVMALFVMAACGETTGEPGVEGPEGVESPGETAPTTP